ncbi:hypothetical protein KCU76_g6060, partial [Aureobasidium melanogenum]
MAIWLVFCTSPNKMASRKKKATNKFKQTRATKNQSSMVNTNEPLGTPIIDATDRAAQPLIEPTTSSDTPSASSTQELDPVQTSIADGSPSNASAATPALAITKSSRKAVAQTQCPLFLPELVLDRSLNWSTRSICQIAGQTRS